MGERGSGGFEGVTPPMLSDGAERLLALFYSFLMISKIPFNSFKKSTFVKDHLNFLLLIFVLLVCVVVVYEKIAIFTLVQIYTFGSLGYYIMNRGRFKNG